MNSNNGSMTWNLNQFYSNIKETDNPVIVGIDEAGRGPVIGPMVYAVYVSYPNVKTAYKDSKLLSSTQRENLFRSIETRQYHDDEIRGYAYFKIHPSYITSQMEAGNLNLNEISREAVKILLEEVKKKCKNVERVFIDGLGNNEQYVRELKKWFNFDFVIENKADSTYQVVSGASIVAKVVRDKEVKGLDCGSGYPSDSTTQKWVLQNIHPFTGLPNIVRHSWKTIKALLDKKKDFELKGSLDGFYIGPK